MRIVSLLSSATEILFALGLGDQVVAISHECDYPAEATHLPRATKSLIDSSRPSQEIDQQVKKLFAAGETLYEIDHALIRGLQPDLIITQAQCDVCAVRYQDVIDFVAAETDLAKTKVVALNPVSLWEIIHTDIFKIAAATDVMARADQLTMELYNRYLAIRDCQPRSTVVVAVIEWTEPLMAAGNWTPELVTAAGGVSVGAVAGEPSGYFTWLDIVAARPEVLIVAPCGFNLERSLAEARKLTSLPSYQDLPAVANRRAFVIDGNAYLNRSGPRIIDTLEILAHLIQPEIFKPPTGELVEGRAWARLTADNP